MHKHISLQRITVGHIGYSTKPKDSRPMGILSTDGMRNTPKNVDFPWPYDKSGRMNRYYNKEVKKIRELKMFNDFIRTCAEKADKKKPLHLNCRSVVIPFVPRGSLTIISLDC